MVVPIWVMLMGAFGRTGLEIMANNKDEEVARKAKDMIQNVDIISAAASSIPLPKK
ncbi:MAG: hypothetical protein FWG77_04070 [Treponema sp.]|nr:hypothetical protein [Treponema sp.]